MKENNPNIKNNDKELNDNIQSTTYNYDEIYKDLYEKLLNSYKKDIKKAIQFIKKFIKFLIFLFLFFILINIVIFSVTIFVQLSQKEYPKQRAILATAQNITKMYIIPLSKLYGRNSKYVRPFYHLRDKLYTKGMSMLPENSMEKEIWWCKIRFIEFEKIIYEENNNYRTYNIKTKTYDKTYTDSDINEYNKWANELYQHIKILQNADISTIIIKNDILLMYKKLIRFYIAFQRCFSIQQQMLDPFYIKYIEPYRPFNCDKIKNIKLPENLKQLENKGICKPPGPKYDAIKYNIELLKSLDELKDKIKKQNLAAYQLYNKITPSIDDYILYKLTYEHVLNYQATFEKIHCDSYELQEYINFKIKIINYMINNPNRTLKQDGIYQLSLDDPFVIPETCVAINNKNKKERDKLHKFYEDRDKEYKKEQEEKLRKEKN